MVRGSVDANIDLTESFHKRSGVQEGSDDEHASDDEAEIWNPDASFVPSFAAFLGGDVGVQKGYLTYSSVTAL